ncbi:hypothetical protein [Litoribacillus peritrichatus]|uniref:Lipoprotein n=1 Tax=Litoribacillus peritrichatus TaxID=718191 RepID=A0ABP7MR82_9GAMM
MPRFYRFFCALSLVILFGCSESENSYEKKAPPISDETVTGGEVIHGGKLASQPLNRAGQAFVNQTATYGFMTKNSVTLPFKDKLTVWDNEHKKLKVFLSPESLSQEEIDRLTKGDVPFFVFSDKASPNQQIWQWFPFVVMEFRFKNDEVNTDNLTSIYVMGYGLEEQNHTDNINTYQDDQNRFEVLSFKQNELKISYQGAGDIMDSQYSWKLEI